MSSIAISVGTLLVALGVGLFAASESRSVTALIPSMIGAVLIACGVIARNERRRMHAMHAAAVVGLLGFIGGLVRGIMALSSDDAKPLAAWGQVGMAVLCGVFVALCVKSFIDARKARRNLASPRS